MRQTFFVLVSAALPEAKASASGNILRRSREHPVAEITEHRRQDRVGMGSLLYEAVVSALDRHIEEEEDDRQSEERHSNGSCENLRCSRVVRIPEGITRVYILDEYER